MNAVYDWVGSLSLTPEHFTLTDFVASRFEEEQSVRHASSVVLYMRERCDDDDDDDDLPKFMVSSDSEASNSLMHVHEPNEYLPNKIMEEDESDHENGSEASTLSQGTFPSETYRRQMRQLERMREVLAEDEEPSTSQTDENHDDKNLQSVREVHVRRATIVDDVLNQFRDPTILRCSLAVTFNDETGLDFGGLTQELFSTFWDAVWDMYFEGETAKVPFVPPQSIANSKAAFKAIGRVLAHGW
ncbi:E3 ubiquitin- ligase TOM1-like, partial, partial [Paramuricea clavata]